MRTLFDMDQQNYDRNGKPFVRPSVRAVIIRDCKVAMVHSLKYDYYKFPGGGMEPEESKEQTLIRETLEESGLRVIPSTIREYGRVCRAQKSDRNDGYEYLLQDNFYYLCEAEEGTQTQILDDYEAEERFTLEFVAPKTAIAVNRRSEHGPKDRAMIEREARVLEMLIAEHML